MIERSALAIAVAIKKANPQQTASIEVLKYALTMYLSLFIIVAESVTIGYLTHKLIETVTALLAIAVLRFFSGGIHAPSTLSCNAVTVLICAGIPHVPKSSLISVHLVTLVSLVIIGWFAPRYSGYVHPIISKYRYPMKFVSILIVILNLFIQSWIIGLCFFVQSLSTICFQRKEERQ